jgi:hypothetical protein
MRKYVTVRSIGFLLLCIVLLFCFGFLVGCGTSQVVSTLDAVVASAQAAVSVLGAAGQIPPGTVALIDTYLKAVSQAAMFASTEINSSDSTAVRITKIVQQFAMITAPNLPAGTAQNIVAVIQAVTQAIASFLTNLQPVGVGTTASIRFSKSDLARLGAIHTKAQAVYNSIH